MLREPQAGNLDRAQRRWFVSAPRYLILKEWEAGGSFTQLKLVMAGNLIELVTGTSACGLSM